MRSPENNTGSQNPRVVNISLDKIRTELHSSNYGSPVHQNNGQDGGKGNQYLDIWLW